VLPSAHDGTAIQFPPRELVAVPFRWDADFALRPDADRARYPKNPLLCPRDFPAVGRKLWAVICQMRGVGGKSFTVSPEFLHRRKL
jgi:hypothetical protein